MNKTLVLDAVSAHLPGLGIAGSGAWLLTPTVSAVMPDGIVIQSMQAATPSSGVGGSGVEYCSGVQVIVDKTALPDRNTGLLGGQTLRVRLVASVGVEEAAIPEAGGK